MEQAENIYVKLEHRFLHRSFDANKGDYGKLLIAAGSEGMAGAAFLSGLAAFRTGVGMVRYYAPACNRIILQTLLPEAMYTVSDRYTGEGNGPERRAAFDWADLMIVGPGFSVTSEARERLLEIGGFLREKTPRLLLLDADALNLIAGERLEALFFTGGYVVITPHIGEMSRLSGIPIQTIKEDPEGTASRYAERFGITVVLKDSRTVITGAGRAAIYENGSPALSKAGSGDVLAGVIAGAAAVTGAGSCRLTAEQVFEAATAAVVLHGRAGGEAAGLYGEHGVLARDTADCICRNLLPQELRGGVRDSGLRQKPGRNSLF